MSKNMDLAFQEAVAGLPNRQRPLALRVLKALGTPQKFPNAPVAFRDALRVARTPVAKASKEMFDSAKYFVTREGLHVRPAFMLQTLLAYPFSLKKRGIEGVESIDLLRNMYDRDIVVEYLGGMDEARKHAFTPDQLADLIDAQWGGDSGVMLNDGRANILYMIDANGALFPVYVSWESCLSAWNVDASTFDAAYWPAGCRVLRNKR